MKVRFFYILLFLCIAALACLLYGFFVEPKRLVIREVSFRAETYQGPPVRIVLLSDLHIGGRHIPASRVDSLKNSVNQLAPDIVLLTGDYIDGSASRSHRSTEFNKAIEQGLQSLGKIEAPLGVFAVLGNHDNWYDGAWVQNRLEDSGMSVLANEGLNLPELCLIGMVDFDTDYPTAEGYEDCRDGRAKIVLTHSPDAFRFLRTDTALAVAGHTHGGQINLPLLGRRVTSTEAGKPLAYGVKNVGGVPVYITAGIGTSMLSARFRAPPEIVVITLQSAG
jgi:predicted MPP superfamily phosphohydrolase